MASWKRFLWSPARDRRGFSLLELLFALAILAVGLLFAATIFPTGYRRMAQGATNERAALKAAQALETAKAMDYELLFPTLHSSQPQDRHHYDVDGDGVEGEVFEWWWYDVAVDSPKTGMTTVTVHVTWLDKPAGSDAAPKELKAVLLLDEEF